MSARARLGLAMVSVALATIALTATAPIRHVSGDTVPGRMGAAVLRCAGTFDLREIDWVSVLARKNTTEYFMYPDRTDEYTSVFGPAPAVVGMLGLVDFGSGDRMAEHELRVRERLVAAVLVALAAVLLVLAAGARCPPLRAGLTGFVAVASFAGAATLGQGLWQATTALPPLVGALATLAWRERFPRLATLATPALLVLAAMLRPTIAPLCGGLGLVWLAHARPRSIRMWALTIGLVLAASAPLVVWNAIHLYSPFPIGQWRANRHLAGEPVFSPWHLARGLAGLVASPARGLVWFAPIMIVGVVRGLRRHASTPDHPWRFAAVGILLQLVTMGMFYKWHGGLAYGPRFLAEATWIGTFLALGDAAAPLKMRTRIDDAARRLALACAVVTCVVGLLGLYLWRPEQWEHRRAAEATPSAYWDFLDSPISSLFHDASDQPIAYESPPRKGLECLPDGRIRTF